MVLIIQNSTAVDRNYLGGAVTVTASSSYTVSSSQIYPISRDPSLIGDCQNNRVFLSDGVSIYMTADAVTYLGQIASSLGGAVIGLVGSTAPTFAILVGSKDSNGNIQAATINSSGGISVSGDAASLVTDAGNPIKIGTVYNATLPAPVSGQRVDAQSNQFGELTVQYRNKYRNVTGNSTVVVKSGSGRLHSIMVNRNWTGGTIVIYDNTVGSGTIIASIDVGTPSGGLLTTTGVAGPLNLGPLGLEFSTGLTVVTSGSTSNNFTVLYY